MSPMHLSLSLGLGSAALGGAWTPARLFAGGEAGAWYDPSDLGTMWEERTDLSYGSDIPASKDSPVCYIEDKSGNGNHATQSVSTARPILRQTAGGLWYLDFDGADDALSTVSGVDLTSTDAASCFVAFKKDTNPSTAFVLFETLSNWRSSSGTLIFSIKANGSLAFGSNGTSFTQTDDLSASGPTASIVASGLSDISDDSLVLRVNGAQTSSLTGDQGSGNYGNHRLFIGSRNDSMFRFNGRLYSLIIRGASSSTQQIASAESYLSAKSGVAL